MKEKNSQYSDEKPEHHYGEDMGQNILIIEDDPEISNLVEFHLQDNGFDLERAEDGRTGLQKVLEGDHALIILDVMLPGMDGLEVCRQLRGKNHQTPILMLTARSEEIDKVVGLEMGADDYLTKPFSVRELVARVKALIRRSQSRSVPGEEAESPGEIQCGPLSINLLKRQVTIKGQTLELTAKEFDLLAMFATHPGIPFTREQLLDRVWGYSYSGYEHTVNSHINRLRSKLEPDPSAPLFIKTVWGVGYRFCEEKELAS